MTDTTTATSPEPQILSISADAAIKKDFYERLKKLDAASRRATLKALTAAQRQQIAAIKAKEKIAQGNKELALAKKRERAADAKFKIELGGHLLALAKDMARKPGNQGNQEILSTILKTLTRQVIGSKLQMPDTLKLKVAEFDAALPALTKAALEKEESQRRKAEAKAAKATPAPDIDKAAAGVASLFAASKNG